MTAPSISLHGFPECAEAASRLAALLGAADRPLAVRRFPDGESLVTAPEAAEIALVYRPLHDPNGKIVEVLLAASALRARGARRVGLVAPYLAYMRQDIAFHPGEAVSQRVIGRLLADTFDAIVTAAPHLHRTPRLEDVFPGTSAAEVDLVPPLAALIEAGGGAEAGAEKNCRGGLALIGPDEESGPLVARLAAATGARPLVARKIRRGDRDVEVTLPPDTDLSGLAAIVVDDVISSGHTIAACARLALAAGARRVEAVACHALHDGAAARLLAEAGIARVASADGVPHPTNALALAPGLAEATRRALADLGRNEGKSPQ